MRWILSLFLLIGYLFVQPAFAESVLDAPAGANKSAAMHNGAGVNSYNDGDWNSAAEHFREAVAIDKKMAEAHFNLGMTLDKLGKHGEASGHFQHALKLGKDNKAITDSKKLKAHTR
jgi:Flp pilus assembly protein TadD